MGSLILTIMGTMTESLLDGDREGALFVRFFRGPQKRRWDASLQFFGPPYYKLYSIRKSSTRSVRIGSGPPHVVGLFYEGNGLRLLEPVMHAIRTKRNNSSRIQSCIHAMSLLCNEPCLEYSLQATSNYIINSSKPSNAGAA
jgi:hypothetical protein